MKYKFLIGTLFVLSLLIVSLPASVSGAQDHDAHDVADHCTTPTAHVSIAATTDLTFNTTELTVEKNTCVMIMFKNQSNVTHDFTIDGDDDMDKVHLAVMNTTDGHMGVKMFNMMTPDDDTEYEFYCSETGHENMVGTLIVGKGKGLPAPSVIFFIGFLATFAVVKKFKKL